MISINDNSEIILRRIDDDNLAKIQEKYHIVQFEATGYKNGGYNVGYFEVIPKK